MKLKEVFEKSVQFFKEKKIESSRLDAELLLASALGIDRLQIYLKFDQPLSDEEISKCRELIRRRSQGEPVAYILGQKGFWGSDYFVGPGVLIPRPETETIVEQALEFAKLKELAAPRILDLGAGSGCVGFAILKSLPEAQLVSVERSPEAYSFLKRNQEKLGLSARSRLHLGDVMSYDPSTEKFDIIVANPPYIAAEDIEVEANVKRFEPPQALFADNAGLEDLIRWSTRFAPSLNRPGVMLFELGYRQGNAMLDHFRSMQIFSTVEILKDLSGLDRVVKGLNNNGTS